MDDFSGSKARLLSSLLEQIVRCADRHHIQPASVCLAWVVASGGNVVAIPGARSPEQVKVALAAAKTCLTANEMAALEKALRLRYGMLPLRSSVTRLLGR